MKIFKRLAAVLTAAVIAVTSFAVTASAESIADTAVTVENNKTNTASLMRYGATADYKIVTSKKGTIEANFNYEGSTCLIELYDTDGNRVTISELDITVGNIKQGGAQTSSVVLKWNSVVEKIEGTIKYDVPEGTYYLRFQDKNFYDSKYGGHGDVKVKFSFPSSEKTATAKINYITITLNKGDTLSLGAALSEENAEVTWKSSKKSVATVSKSGKVTAKKKGSTIITAKCGSSSKKIKIVVS